LVHRGEMHVTLLQSSIRLSARRCEFVGSTRWSSITLDNQCSSLEFLDSKSSMAVIQCRIIQAVPLDRQEGFTMAMMTLLRYRQIDSDQDKQRC